MAKDTTHLSGERYLTTSELAELLRIKQRKVYDLAAQGDVPCSRATGKLLFPETQIRAWLADHGQGYSHLSKSRPYVLLGSHDPLLDWAIRESECGLATYYNGSSDGLRRFNALEGIATGLHLVDSNTGLWNVDSVEGQCRGQNAVLIEFGWRERGMILSKDIDTSGFALKNLIGLRVAGRQPGSGAQRFLEVLLAKDSIATNQIQYSQVTRTETEAADAISTGQADVTFGLQSVAKQYNLPFIGLAKERFDILVNRKAWFEPGFQSLFEFLKGSEFATRVLASPGYDCDGLGTVHFNGD